MKKIVLVSILLVFSLGLNSCIQPKFNQNNKGIVFSNGKAYAIPHYTIAKASNASIRNWSGINCPTGHVIWMEKEWRDSLRSKKPNKKQTRIACQKAKYNGFLGCVPPLSNREYQYMLNQQNQRVANARFQQQQLDNTISDFNRNMATTAAAYAPKTYNVYHHYGY